MKKLILIAAIAIVALTANAQTTIKTSVIVSSQRRHITLTPAQIVYLSNFGMQRVRDIMEVYKNGGTIRSDAADLIFMAIEHKRFNDSLKAK